MDRQICTMLEKGEKVLQGRGWGWFDGHPKKPYPPNELLVSRSKSSYRGRLDPNPGPGWLGQFHTNELPTTYTEIKRTYNHARTHATHAARPRGEGMKERSGYLSDRDRRTRCFDLYLAREREREEERERERERRRERKGAVNIIPSH